VVKKSLLQHGMWGFQILVPYMTLTFPNSYRR
jgi:hypothetical protein